MALEVTPLHPTLGAELRGVDSTRPVAPRTERDREFLKVNLIAPE